MILQTNSVHMSKNHEIIMLFLSDFYRDKRAELAEIISPNFLYSSPFFGDADFNEYVDWMSKMSNQRSITNLSQLESDNDRVFNYSFKLKVLDFTDGFEEEMIGKTTIIINDGLIEFVENSYVDASSNPEKFRRIRDKFMQDP